MKAIIIRQFGERDVLELADIPKPKIQPGEVLVKIVAAGVNPVDWKIRKGLLKGRMPYELPITLGWEASGVIDEVGSEVKNFEKGDAVFAYTRKEKIHDGSYAEFIALEPRHLVLKPKNLSFEESAAIPLAGLTAYQSLFESLQLQNGEKILIHAGAGGVGSFAIQLAKTIGAYTITTASEKNHDYVRKLGTDEVIDYTKEDFVKAVLNKHPEGIDAVFDTVGDETQKKSADVLKKGGRLTSLLALDEEFFKKKGLKPGYVFVRPEPSHLDRLRKLIEEDRLKVSLFQIFPISEVKRAHEAIETGHVRGKIVLRIG
ncbi:MAG: NADP-dependent oxidoreductase [Deltaproteobacteria bacterium]|nr:NADP-dependent oxidoreductase [Deltaproteobacteria bacterium]